MNLFIGLLRDLLMTLVIRASECVPPGPTPTRASAPALSMRLALLAIIVATSGATTVSVSSYSQLSTTLSSTSHDVVIVAPGTYIGNVLIERSVEIRAEVPGTVDFAGSCSGSIMYTWSCSSSGGVHIRPPAPSDVVKLVGINVKWGYAPYGAGTQVEPSNHIRRSALFRSRVAQLCPSRWQASESTRGIRLILRKLHLLCI